MNSFDGPHGRWVLGMCIYVQLFLILQSIICLFLLFFHPHLPGAAFTRFQTLRLQKIFPEVLAEQLISYGSCQFPTLGFVVERFKAIQSFVPEIFHKIKGRAVEIVYDM